MATGDQGRQRPHGSGKGSPFYERKRTTAARRKARRMARGKRSGKRSWLRGWPGQDTQKGGKNAGRAPSYTAAQLTGDDGSRPGKSGSWPYGSGVKSREVR